MQHFFDYLEDICNRDTEAVSCLYDVWANDKASFFHCFQQTRLVHQDCVDCTFPRDLVLLSMKEKDGAFLQDAMMTCDAFLSPSDMRKIFKETCSSSDNLNFSAPSSLLNCIERTVAYFEFLPHNLQTLDDIAEYFSNGSQVGIFGRKREEGDTFWGYREHGSPRLPLGILMLLIKRCQYDQAERLFSELVCAHIQHSEHKNKETFRQFDESLAGLAFHPQGAKVKEIILTFSSGGKGADFAYLLPQTHSVVMKQNILKALDEQEHQAKKTGKKRM